VVVEYIRYTIEDARAQAFEQAYRRSGEALKVSPHCEHYEVSRCSEDPTQYVVRIEWDSEEGHMKPYEGDAMLRGLATINYWTDDMEAAKRW
jgi:hemoglobin